MAEFQSFDPGGVAVHREIYRAILRIPCFQARSNVLAVADAGHRGKQAQHPLARCLGTLHLDEDLGDLIDRSKELARVENERD